MLFLAILSILLSNSVILRRDIAILFNRIAIISLIYCISIILISFIYIKLSLGIHGGLLHITSITQIFQILIFLITILILLLTSFSIFPNEMNIISLNKNINNFNFYLKKIEIKNTWQKIFIQTNENLIEYPLIILFIISGGIFLISTNDLITIFLSIELQSYGLYLLSTIFRNSELSTAGGLIYFLLGGFSSSLILLGISLLYINSGTTNLDNIYIITSITEEGNFWYNFNYINISLFIFSIGFLFKISAAPFHFWSPDVYDSIPTVVTIFVAIVAKISIFIFLLGLVFYTNIYLYNNNSNWYYILLASSIFSLIIGTFLGLTQFRIKKLLAYSAISHVGFLLLALNISNIESTQAFIFYLIQYTFTSLNAFTIIFIMGFYLIYSKSKSQIKYNLIDEIYSPLQLISQLKGFFFINPLLTLSFAITIFSFAGIPPLMGFFAKQMVLSSAINSNFLFIVYIAIITSVIGGVYYLNIIKESFSNEDNITINKKFYNKDSNFYTFLNIPSFITLIISIITLVILLFIFTNKELLSICTILVQILYNY